MINLCRRIGRRPPSGAWLVVIGLAAAGLAQETGAAPQPITLAGLLGDVVDLDRLTRPPQPGERSVLFCGTVGGQARREAARKAGRAEPAGEGDWLVLAEVGGPGVIRRLAIHPAAAGPAGAAASAPSTNATTAPTAIARGQLRVESGSAVLLENDLGALYAGSLPPFAAPLVAPEGISYFPIAFQDGCRILTRGWSGDYEIHLTRFAAAARVQPFSPQLDEAAQLALAQVTEILQQAPSERVALAGRRASSLAAEQAIRPGEMLSESWEGAGTVRALYVGLADRNDPPEPYTLRRLVLRIYVDGKPQPAIEVPLVDFFGSAYERDPHQSLVTATHLRISFPLPERLPGEDTFLASFWPMPFRDGLRIEIENLNEARRRIALVLHARIDPQPPPPDSLRLFGQFQHRLPGGAERLPLLDAAGPGRLVGLVLSIDSLDPAWADLAGLRLEIDGRRAESEPAVSLQHLLGMVPPGGAVGSPLAGLTRANPTGKSAGYRWLVPDGLAFHRALASEIAPAGEARLGQMYLGAVTLWYGEPDSTAARRPLGARDLEPPGLRLANSVEVEDGVRGPDSVSVDPDSGKVSQDLGKVGQEWGSVMRQKHAGGVELSGGAAAYVTTDRPVRMEIPARIRQRVRLGLRVHPRRSFETIEVWGPAEQAIGTVQYDHAAGGRYIVGEVELSAGANSFLVRCSKPAVLDCWILEPLER